MMPPKKPAAAAIVEMGKIEKNSEMVPGKRNFIAESTCEGFILELGNLPRFLVESLTLH